MISVILAMSTELLAGAGAAAPNRSAVVQNWYGETDYGYNTWFTFFFQLSYVKGLPLGIEPYFRVTHMDHNQRLALDVVDGVEMGSRLNESMVTYEFGLTRPIYRRSRFYLLGGVAFTGNFCHWERQFYGSSARIIDQVTPGVLGLARMEYREDYKEWLGDKNVTVIVGIAGRLNYMDFRPEVWPCQEWYGLLDVYAGVRW